jgi:hypothetical protein
MGQKQLEDAERKREIGWMSYYTSDPNFNNYWTQMADEGNGLFAVAVAIERLGNNNSDTRMGAIEAYGKHIGDKMDALTEAIGNGRSK